ncbi:MAG: hypothetical protein D4R41_01365, partial [Sediminibacterium sp.]
MTSILHKTEFDFFKDYSVSNSDLFTSGLFYGIDHTTPLAIYKAYSNPRLFNFNYSKDPKVIKDEIISKEHYDDIYGDKFWRKNLFYDEAEFNFKQRQYDNYHESLYNLKTDKDMLSLLAKHAGIFIGSLADPLAFLAPIALSNRLKGINFLKKKIPNNAIKDSLIGANTYLLMEAAPNIESFFREGIYNTITPVTVGAAAGVGAIGSFIKPLYEYFKSYKNFRPIDSIFVNNVVKKESDDFINNRLLDHLNKDCVSTLPPNKSIDFNVMKVSLDDLSLHTTHLNKILKENKDFIIKNIKKDKVSLNIDEKKILEKYSEIEDKIFISLDKIKSIIGTKEFDTSVGSILNESIKKGISFDLDDLITRFNKKDFNGFNQYSDKEKFSYNFFDNNLTDIDVLLRSKLSDLNSINPMQYSRLEATYATMVKKVNKLRHLSKKLMEDNDINVSKYISNLKQITPYLSFINKSKILSIKNFNNNNLAKQELSDLINYFIDNHRYIKYRKLDSLYHSNLVFKKMEEFEKSPYLGMSRHIEDTQLLQRTVFNNFASVFMQRLDQSGLIRYFKNSKNDIAVIKEIATQRIKKDIYKRNTNPASKLAFEIIELQKLIQHTMRSLGLYSPYLKNYVFKQTHDVNKIIKQGFKNWSDKVKSSIDIQKTFPGATDFDLALKEFYNELTTHKSLGNLYGVESGGYINRQNRLLHFLTAENAYAYNLQYGKFNSLYDIIISSIDDFCRKTSIIRKWGVDPMQTKNLVEKSIMQSKNDDVINAMIMDKKGSILTSEKLFNYMLNINNDIANESIATFGKYLRSFTNWSVLLGGFPSCIFDASTMIVASRAVGSGTFTVLGEVVKSYFLANKSNRTFIKDLGIFATNSLRSIINVYS